MDLDVEWGPWEAIELKMTVPANRLPKVMDRGSYLLPIAILGGVMHCPFFVATQVPMQMHYLDDGQHVTQWLMRPFFVYGERPLFLATQLSDGMGLHWIASGKEMIVYDGTFKLDPR